MKRLLLMTSMLALLNTNAMADQLSNQAKHDISTAKPVSVLVRGAPVVATTVDHAKADIDLAQVQNAKNIMASDRFYLLSLALKTKAPQIYEVLTKTIIIEKLDAIANALSNKRCACHSNAHLLALMALGSATQGQSDALSQSGDVNDHVMNQILRQASAIDKHQFSRESK